MLDVTEFNDEFGYAQGTGYYDGEEYVDLVAVIVGEDPSTVSAGAAVQIIFGGSSELVSSGNRLWHQNSSTTDDIAETSDFFGCLLSPG